MAEVHGNRTPRKNTDKTVDSPASGAQSGALDARQGSLNPDLAAVVDAWPALPEAIKTGILAIIRGAK